MLSLGRDRYELLGGFKVELSCRSTRGRHGTGAHLFIGWESPESARKERWLPAIEFVVKQLAKTDAAFRNATNHINRRYFEDDKFPAYEAHQLFLKSAAENFSRLQMLVDVNSAALTSHGLPNAVVFLDSLESLHKRLIFFATAQKSEFQSKDVIGTPPFEELETMDRVVGKFRAAFPAIFTSRVTEDSHILTPNELRAVWLEAAQKNVRLCFEPEKYHCRENVDVFAYDVQTMRNIIENAPIGAKMWKFLD
jgi:hypothetical protein